MKVNLDNIRLYENDNIIEINRDVDIGKHLPQDIIGKGLEFSEIRGNENYELSHLFLEINRLLKNTFIQSADRLGLDFYEKLIGEKIDGSLEERRRKIYALWNKKTIWTHRTLIEWLNEYVGTNNYELDLHYNAYKIEFKIFVSSRFETDQAWLRKQLRMIIPANLGIIWTLVFRQEIYYGLADQRRHKVTIYPNEAEDQTVTQPLYFAAGYYAKKIKTKDLPIEVWILDEYGMQAEVTGYGGERLKYDRDK